MVVLPLVRLRRTEAGEDGIIFVGVVGRVTKALTREGTSSSEAAVVILYVEEE